MRNLSKVLLGDILKRSDTPLYIDPEVEYKEVTVRLWGKGVILRGGVLGANIVSPRRVIRANQLILSKIDARNGAIGLVPPELDGSIVSNDFPSFDIVGKNLCDIAYIGWMVRSPSFVGLCKRASSGTTNRVRIKEDRFLEQEVFLPPLVEQRDIVARLELVSQKTQQVEGHLDTIERDAERLLAQRFQEAIENAPLRPMRDVAPLVRREIEIDDGCQYIELGVRSFYKGTFHRRTVFGVDFSWQTLYEVKSGDLVFSNIMAWEKAISIARPEDDACVGNHRMLTCEAIDGVMLPGFLFYYFTTEDGFSKIYAASPGTAARNRTMTARALMNIEVPVPSVDVQQDFVLLQSKILALKSKHAAIREANVALLPAMLERMFAVEEQSHG